MDKPLSEYKISTQLIKPASKGTFENREKILKQRNFIRHKLNVAYYSKPIKIESSHSDFL